MVFNGRPTRACALCKRRRKKCDLTKPQCKQCISRGEKCPGIPDEVDVIFRNKFVIDQQNSSQKTVGIQPQGQQNDQPDRDASHSKELRGQKHDSIRLFQAVPTDWLSTAMTYFLNTHCRGDLPTRRLNPWLGIQSEWYVAPTPSTGLSHAVSAMAAMTMATELQIPALVEMSNKPYGQALRAVNSALTDSHEAVKNDVAVSIFVLTSYELRHVDTNRRHRYQAHTDGLRELLLLRGRKQLEDVESLYVFRSLRVQIIYNHILRGTPLIRSDDEAESIWTDASPYNATPVDDLLAVAARIPHLRVQAKKICTKKSDSLSRSLIHNALQVDQKLSQWLARWQDNLKYEVAIKSGSDHTLWQSRAHIFTDLSVAALMNHYCFLRILLLDALLKAYENAVTVDEELKLKHEDVLQQIRVLIDNICYSIPFMTGQVRDKSLDCMFQKNQKWIYTSHEEATWIILPIVIAAQQATISIAQKSWLTQRLIQLNADFGLWDASSLPRDSEKKLLILPTNSNNFY